MPIGCLPGWKKAIVGMLMMLNACEIRGFASTSTFTTSIEPSYLAAIFSISGATILHGPHQVAQKSTTTGFSFLRTSCSNVSSVACWMAMGGSFPPADARGCAYDRSRPSGARAGQALAEPVRLEGADVGEAIEDRRPIAPALDEPGAAENGEVLAHVGHLASDLGREISDGELPGGQRLEHAQALRVGERTA